MAEPTELSTFETSMERLEAIVEAMEGDRLPLEEMLVRYEEGTRLVKLCAEKLAAAEKRIQIIARNAAGEPQAVDFDPQNPPKMASPVTPLADEPQDPVLVPTRVRPGAAPRRATPRSSQNLASPDAGVSLF